MKRIGLLMLGQLTVLRRAVVLLVWAHLSLVGVHAGDLEFSDPAKVPSMPAWAVGQANRSPGLDALPGFQQPPPGFGNVPFYWWLGDPLTKERIGWQLEQMAGMAVSGIQINYAHSDKGGRSWGLTYTMSGDDCNLYNNEDLPASPFRTDDVEVK